jgi:hypothetical protein
MVRAAAVLHYNPAIPWHTRVAPRVATGLRRCGIPHVATISRERISPAPAILLGTSFWRAVEATGPFILLDRCSFGSPDQFMTLVRDGHGRRGDHRVPDRIDGSRWERFCVPVSPWRSGGTRTVLCGQIETWSPHYRSVAEWYGTVAGACTHFRRHPASRRPAPFGLPEIFDWNDVGKVVTLNSSVAIDAVLAGIPTVTLDEAAMAWDVTGHAPDITVTPDRRSWLHWLAWTQWTHDEMEEGSPWPRFL